MSRFALILALWACPLALMAGDLEGTVRVTLAPVAETNREEYPGADAEEFAPEPPPGNAVEEVVLYLEASGAGGESRTAQARGQHPLAVMSQRDKTFVPRVLPIKVGTAVRFPNDDSLFHNVFSYSKAKKFDLGRFNTGESRSVVFDQVGLVKVFCEIHSRMKAVILVLDTDAFTVPDPSGAYRLADIPPGKYTLVVFHPQLESRRIPIEIGEKTTRLDLQL